MSSEHKGRGERPTTPRPDQMIVRPPKPPIGAEAPPLLEGVPVGDQVEATVTRGTLGTPPAPPKKKVFMCFGHPGITREIRVEDIALNGPPFCTQCGIRMAEDITGKL